MHFSSILITSYFSRVLQNLDIESLCEDIRISFKGLYEKNLAITEATNYKINDSHTLFSIKGSSDGKKIFSRNCLLRRVTDTSRQIIIAASPNSENYTPYMQRVVLASCSEKQKEDSEDRCAIETTVVLQKLAFENAYPVRNNDGT